MPSQPSFEQEPNPIEVIKWKEIYENFEEGTDRCEDVSNILERIALKQPLMSHQNFRPDPHWRYYTCLS